MFNTIQKFLLIGVFIFTACSVSIAQDDTKSTDAGNLTTEVKKDEPAGIKTDDGVIYGKDYDHSMTVITFGDLMKAADDNNGKTVVVSGDVSEVCQKMGCWMTMTDGSKTVRVKTLHEFFLPKDVAGRKAVVVGTFNITEISEEDAKHYNEESNNPVSADEIKGPQKAYEIDAAGIKILDADVSDPSK